MASVSEPSSSSTIPAMPRAEERAVDEQIRRTRRSLKWVDFASGMITLVIGVLVFLLCVSMLEHWVVPGGWNGPGRVLLFVAMLGGIAWYSWRTFWPLVSRPINPAYAAQLIERSSPSLKNSLLNFLLLRNRRQQLSQKVYQAIEQQAAQRLSEVSLDSVIDRTALVRLGYVLVAVVVACALYRVLSPKNLTASMERVLMPWSDIAVPSRVEILDVTPGDTQIARGEQLEVSAEVFGIRDDEPVKVRYSTLDGQSVDREVTLSASAGGSRFTGRLPDRFSGGDRASEGNSGGVQQDLEYWIEAGDAKSPKYGVTVFARPTLVVEKIRYQFPPYTGLAAREVEGTGDIHAIEGTKVTLYAQANHEIASAQVDFNADGRHDLAMTADKAKASAQFTLNLGEDRRTPEFDRYVLQYKTTNGRVSSLPPTYKIDVTPDYAPEIRITAPVDDEGKLVEQLDVPLDSQFTVEVEARDPDFALANVVVLGESAGEQVLRKDLLEKSQSGKFVGRMTATPAELGLKPGDELEYWGAAVDNRQPEPNTAQTERLRILVLGPPQFGDQQGQGQQPQGGGAGESGEQSGDGESGEQGEGLSGAGESGGESGEQGGEGEGGGAGEQSGENQSEGEQEGQGGQGGGQGENSEGADGEPASAGGDQQNGDQQNGEQQNEGQQNGEQQNEQQSDPNGQGGENSEGGDASQGDASQERAGGQGKVSTEGDDDAEAFDRMNQHFSEEEAQSEGEEGEKQEGEGQPNEGDSKGQQGDGQNSETQSGQSAGEGKPDSDQSSKGESADDAQTQEGGTEGPQEGEQSEGAGAEGQPSDQQKGKPRSSDKSEAGGEKNQEQQSPEGEMSPEQGEQGAGNNPGEEQGSPDSPEGREPKEKDGEQAPDSQENDQEAPMQGQGNKESDSQGGQGGDRAGGGQEGAGQQADSEGTGTAGENTAADEGGGQAEESGAGENSSKAGQDVESDKPTGESGKNQTGDGSKQSDQQGGSKPGGEQQGDQGGEGEQQPGESPAADGEQGQQPGESPPSGNPQAGGQQQGEQPPGESQPDGNAGQQPPGAGTGSNNASAQPPGEVEPGDAANLDYAKKQTDLVLDKLDDQLKKSDVDKELLEKLGWTEEELRQFVNRWKKLKAEAAIAPEEKQQELDNALRSLGLDRARRTGFQSQAVKEKLRDLKDSYRGQTPLEYADQVRAYIKGTATVPEEKKE